MELIIMNRIDALIKNLPTNVDCVLVTSDYGRYYFTGLRSSAGTLVITREESYFIIDFRYIEKATATIKNAQVILQDKLQEQIKTVLGKHNIKNIAVETDYMTVSQFTKMRDELSDYTLLDTKEANVAILDLRAHKDAGEIASIRKAQAIADEAFTYMLGHIKAGMTEREVALALEHKMSQLGGEKVSFDTISVSGVNSSLPHGVPCDKKLEDGDFLTLDFGTIIDGYHSDMTRTVAIGHATEEMKKVYATVLEANLASIATIALGVTNKEVDKVGRDIIYTAGYEGCFGHGTGHSVGLEIHEEPRYSTLAEGVVEVGQVMTVEPGIYLAGKFGVRIEDMIYITANGIEVISTSPKELIVL